MRAAAVLVLGCVLGCASGPRAPRYEVGARALTAQSALFDLVPNDSGSAGAMVLLVDAPDACAAHLKLSCEALNGELPPWDSLALLLQTALPGEYRIGGDATAEAGAVLGFRDEPGRRDIVEGTVELVSVSDPRLTGRFSLKTLRGAEVKGDFDATRCDGLLRHIMQCQLPAQEARE